jgi:hypothetical protein
MISTFDLILLGGLVSVGGAALLGQGKRAHMDAGRLTGQKPAAELTVKGVEEGHARLTALAGARWLTVGALTLFIAYAHGAEEGYLFGPWTDVMFHLVFVSTCWITTLYRINQTAQRTAAISAVSTRPRQSIS